MPSKNNPAATPRTKQHSGDREPPKKSTPLGKISDYTSFLNKRLKTIEKDKIKNASDATPPTVEGDEQSTEFPKLSENESSLRDLVLSSDSEDLSGSEPDEPVTGSEPDDPVPIPKTKVKAKLKKLPTFGSLLKGILRASKSSLTPQEEVENDAEFLKCEVNHVNLGKIRSVRPGKQIVMFHQVFTEFVTCKRKSRKLRQEAENEVRRTECEARKRKLSKIQETSTGNQQKKPKSQHAQPPVSEDPEEQPTRRNLKRKIKTGNGSGPLAAKYMKVNEGTINDDWQVSSQRDQWIQLASEQRMFMWSFDEFMPTAEKEHTAAEFDDYITLFREYAEKSGVSDEQQMTRLQISCGKAVKDALAIIRTRRLEPFDNFDEMANALAEHWKDGIDQLSIEEKFKNTKRAKAERFCDYFQRLQVSVNKLITVRKDPKRLIKTEQLLFATVATSANDEKVQLKARTLHNEKFVETATKTARIEKFVSYLRNRDEHDAANTGMEVNLPNEDFVAMMETGSSNKNRHAGYRFSDDREYDRNFNFSQRNRPGYDRTMRVQTRDQFERRSDSFAKPICKKCNERHAPDRHCKCGSCGFHHSTQSGCPICFKCNTRGHKAFQCRGPPPNRTEYEKKGNMKTESFKQKEVKKVEPIVEDDEKSKVNDLFNFHD